MNKQQLAVLASLLMQVMTGHAAARCQLSPLHNMTVAVSGNRVVVPGSVNRHEARLFLDTGASQSYIDQSLATELELPRRPSNAFAWGGPAA